MSKIKGNLVQGKKGFMVNLPTRKGTSSFPIPLVAKQFADADAEDGLEVDVEKDAQNLIIKVTIPGKTVTAPPPRRPDNQRGNRGGNRGNYQTRGSQPVSLQELPKANPSVLGSPFHNPYTFIPFPENAPPRNAPTLHTADEAVDSGRYSGVLRLNVKTLSPLMTCESQALVASADHKAYRALTIGNDVILPATGVRGALRTLLTIVTGGTLGYLNTDETLCNGRDVNLGPAGKRSPKGTPLHCFLAEVITAGTARRSGRIRMGQKDRLVSVEQLKSRFSQLDKHRNSKATPLWAELDSNGNVAKVIPSKQSPSPTAGRLKLSGRPINSKGKREGIFFPTDTEFEMPAEYWGEYSERNKHGDRPTLKPGDLVWLHPHNPETEVIDDYTDVESIQWARWGKRGQKLVDLVREHHPGVMPDNLASDGQVDAVTDLFGQIPVDRDSNAPAFAARVRPDNLVFQDARAQTETVTLAPLAQPHPGCIGFYRKSSDPDSISENDPLSGFKVYRTTDATDDANAPWRFENQGTYGDGGELKSSQTSLNKTCELLNAGQTGDLSLSFTALSKHELALLIQACSIPWRLGGGKPLGLGRCLVSVMGLIDDLGAPLQVPGWTRSQSATGTLTIDGWQSKVQSIASRVDLWKHSQRPVPLLRYPRAVEKTQFKKSRGGHAWFGRHAKPRAGDKEGARKPGLEAMHIDGPLKSSAEAVGQNMDSRHPMIAAQPLPPLDPTDIHADALYGYDLLETDSRKEIRPNKKVILSVEPFDESTHRTGDEKSSGNHGKNKEFRDENRDRG